MVKTLLLVIFTYAIKIKIKFFMKEMSLKDVQNVSLDILKDVHSFCESHDIKYSLAYGTLIGAIRHKGFIPWDDDVDILIPRPDFERFCREYHSDKGYDLYPPGESGSFMVFARVCDNKHTLVKTNRPWAAEPSGVWIDIFPLDGLPTDEKVFFKHVKHVRAVAAKVYRLRLGKFLKLKDTIGLKDLLFCLVKKILYYGYDIKEQMDKHISLLKSFDYNLSDYCGQLCVMDYPEKEHNPKTDFISYTKVPFEDSEFYVMNGYDAVLSRYYGNYMTLPPEADRVHPQALTQQYFWK